MYYWARTCSRARARKENGASSVENLKMILMALSYIAVLVTRKCTHAAWRFKIEIVTSNSAFISFHQHSSRISCCIASSFSSYSLACHNQHLLSKLPLIPPAFIAVMVAICILPFSWNFFIRRYRILFVITTSSLNHCCLIAKE